MKNFSLWVFTLFFSLSNYAQSDDGKSMKPILEDALPIINTVEKKGYEIVRIEFDIIKDEKVTYRQLYEGWEYGVYAFGDYRIEDMDVEVYKEVGGNWKLVVEDSDESSTALVNVKPLYTGNYKIVVKAAKFASGYKGGHYGLLIFHE